MGFYPLLLAYTDAAADTIKLRDPFVAILMLDALV